MRRFVVWLLVLSLGGATASGDPFVDSVRARCEAVLVRASDAGGVFDAVGEAQALAALAAGWASAGQLEAVGWGEGTLALLETAALAGVDGLGPMGAQAEFCVELGLLVDERDDPRGVIELAQRLVRARGDAVARYPRLAAALCVVHDKPYSRRINENTVHAPDPLAVFDYFVTNAGAMRVDPAGLASLLLVHVVDVTERIDQLEWALRTYGRNPSPGERFFEINYDYDAFRKGTVKRVTAAGNYRLQSIRRHGGVCADQAYFAESVGKAAGVPSCYVRAAGADVSHAWVGFLASSPRPAWDFSQGRWEAYQNLRGLVRDPQTGTWVSDADVGLLGGLVRASPGDVRATMGAARAARRMATAGDGFSAPASWNGVTMQGTRPAARTASVDHRLGLLRAALTRCASVPRAWSAAVGFAGEMSRGQLDEWARAVDRLCGRTHQDFTFDVLTAMVRAEESAEAAHAMWEWAFSRFRARPDLASAVRFEQGRLWATHGRPDMAWVAYQDVVGRFINDGPMVVEALASMRALLDANGKRPAFVVTLEDAARRVRAPGRMAQEFRTQSNYYKIHTMLADELARLGRGTEAAQVRERARIGG